MYFVLRCIPKTANESFYWSGDYCDYKIYSPSTSDQIKMIITVATLGTCLLEFNFLIFYLRAFKLITIYFLFVFFSFDYLFQMFQRYS